jgi:acetylornithine deacetylase/succinyl-diaminopimelate desuccinylase-like protein
MPAPPSVIEALELGASDMRRELEVLSRIPSVSAAGFPPAEVDRCAEAVADLLRRSDLERVEVLRPGGCHPYVVAEWLHAGDDATTLLLYAHYDVQPPGRPERWHSPAFEPAERAGRLFGRGVVDDKAGLVILVAAIRAWLSAEGGLPVNLKLVIEGEEEIGSTHLAEFLSAEHERLAADVIILTDTANLEAGLPSITTSLRGLVNIDLRVRALDHPLHSGMWGGPVRDAASALAVLLGRLFDSDGGVAIPGFRDDVPEPSAGQLAELAALPFDVTTFREDAGLPPGVVLHGNDAASVYRGLWLEPALCIIGLEAVPLASAANKLIDEAAARISVRLAPGQDATRMRDRVCDVLRSTPPYGVSVELECESAVDGWRREPTGPALEAARRALSLGYGREAVLIGCGGGIPFVAPFSEALGGAEALLLGLEDPICNAHGENESLHLGDFALAQRAAAHLFDELRNRSSMGRVS